MPALLFDYGGTLDSAARHWNYILLDAYRYLAQSFAPELKVVDGDIWRTAYVYAERTLEAHPLVLPEDDMCALLLKKARLQLQQLMEQGLFVLSTERAEGYAQAIAHHCDQSARRHAKKSQHILQTLRQRGYTLYIASNFYGNLTTVLRTYGLLSLFEHITESAPLGLRKPDPRFWQKAIEATGLPSHECVVIGDSYSKDIAPAAALGCTTIWCEGEPWEPKSHDRSLPTHIISDLSQILDLLNPCSK